MDSTLFLVERVGRSIGVCVKLASYRRSQAKARRAARRQTDFRPPEEASPLVRLSPHGGIVAPGRGVRMGATRGGEPPDSEPLSPGRRQLRRRTTAVLLPSRLSRGRGGKVMSSKTKASANRAAKALRLAANALHRSDSALESFLRRKKSHLGSPKAITATAHKLARIISRCCATASNMWTPEPSTTRVSDEVQRNINRLKSLPFHIHPLLGDDFQFAQRHLVVRVDPDGEV